ncbi:unnamed protein product [Symbiodinium necroappetens]|uniref:Uncharacterized protein n=1 Tax=Symbiodinium necroappetens TaxID=1628268 RepID=A0A812R8T1_9DINO|nr:unnamed protein product [Symbiodinium necroappetens]
MPKGHEIFKTARADANIGPSLRRTKSSIEILFTMHVVLLKTLLEMVTPKPHEELEREGLLVSFRSFMGDVIFVSHQWTGLHHPDCSGEQLRFLQEALRPGLQGRRIQPSIESEMLNMKRPKGETQAVTPRELFVWYDFFSCPQEDRTNLHAAISSIPAYIESCKYFVILAPFVRHENGDLMGRHSWSQRAWCRFERMARVLSKREDASVMIEIQSGSHLTEATTFEWVKCPVGEGAFSFPEDRPKVANAMCEMLRDKLKYYLSSGDMHNFRVMLNLQRVLLRGLGEDPVEDLIPGGSGLDPMAKFMHQNCLKNMERQRSGWSPLCYAVLSGDTKVVSALLQGKADVNDRITKRDNIMQFAQNTTVLDMCSFLKHNECVMLLLEARADLARKDGYSAMAVHWAAGADNQGAVRILKERGSSMSALNILGLEPIHMAVAGGHVHSMMELLDITSPESLSLALHVSILYKAQSPEAVAILIEKKADINNQLALPTFSTLSLLFGAMTLRHKWRQSLLSTYAHHHSKATPLMLSLCSQAYAAAAILIASGARLDLKNSRGCTAADIAQLTAAPEWVLRAARGEAEAIRACEDMADEHGHRIWLRM